MGQSIISAENNYRELDQWFADNNLKTVILICGKSIERLTINRYLEDVRNRSGIVADRLRNLQVLLVAFAVLVLVLDDWRCQVALHLAVFITAVVLRRCRMYFVIFVRAAYNDLGIDHRIRIQVDPFVEMRVVSADAPEIRHAQDRCVH